MPASTEHIDTEGSVLDTCAVVDQDSWQTSFTAVSWSYPCPTQDQLPKPLVYAKPPHYHHSLFHISPSHHDSTSSDPRCHRLEIEADDLNPDLVGVRAAGDVIQKYEIDVGFYYADHFDLNLVSRRVTPPSTSPQSYLCEEVDEEEVKLNRERWHHLVRGLTYGILDGDCISSVGLHRSASTLSSIDLSDSEPSIVSNSMPSTPKPKSLYANVLVKDQSPTSPDSDHICHHRRVTSRLNASASSFIPTSTTPDKAHSSSFRLPPSPSTASMSSPSPTSTDFTFPSLNSSVSAQSQSPPSIVLEKDEQGFYQEVTFSSLHGSANTSQRPVFARLPPFLTDPLRRRKSSKTRTIVDGLRILGSQASKSKSVGPSPSPSPSGSAFNDLDLDFFKPRLSVSEDGGDSRSADVDEGDGWIRPWMCESGDLESKAQRTKDLCLALGRNRAGSRAGREGKEGKDDDIDLGYQFLNERSSVYSQASSSPSQEVTSTDGWIEGTLPSTSRPRKFRSRNLNPNTSFSSLSSQTVAIPPKPQPSFTATPFIPVPVSVQPTPYFPVPVMYPNYAHPYIATAGYVQMQMQMQSQLHLQMQIQAQSHHPWFQPVAYPVPLVPVPAQTAAPRSNHV